MITRRQVLAGAATLTSFAFMGPGLAQEKASDRLKVLATFSILGDFVKNVGGNRVEVTTLVGPDSDAHVYAPAPADARKVADARLVIANGLGFEGWMSRLVTASGSKAPLVVATKGITVRKAEAAKGRGEADPHAWQSVTNAKVYVSNIYNAMLSADPAGKITYEANTAAYLAKLDALDREVKAAIYAIPPDRRRVISTHDAFGYFEQDYGIDFIAPARRLDRFRALRARHRAHHHPDQAAESPGGVSGEHRRSAIDAADRQGIRRPRRRQALF